MNRLSSNIPCLASFLLIVVSFAGCYLFDETKQHPYGKLPPVAKESYFVCNHCGSLNGGLSGTGPSKQLNTEAGKKCVHDWQPISREDFKRRGTEQFHVDWSQEIPFWTENR